MSTESPLQRFALGHDKDGEPALRYDMQGEWVRFDDHRRSLNEKEETPTVMEQGVPQPAREAAYKAVRSASRGRSHHASMPDGVTISVHARAAVDAAYPAIRDQVLADLRKALTKLAPLPDAAAPGKWISLAEALATLSPSEDTTEGDEWFCKGCGHMASGRTCDGCGYAFDWPQEPSEGSGAPLPEAAKAKYPPAERLVESLRWAIGLIGGLKEFDPDQAPCNGGDEEHDWMEWASARDWLKDAELAALPLPEGEKCEPEFGRPESGWTCGGKGTFSYPHLIALSGPTVGGPFPCPGCEDCTGKKPLPEAWPSFVVQRFEQDDPIRPYRYVVLDGTQSTDFSNCHRYVPRPLPEAPRCGGEPTNPGFFGRDSEDELAAEDGFCRGCPDCKPEAESVDGEETEADVRAVERIADELVGRESLYNEEGEQLEHHWPEVDDLAWSLYRLSGAPEFRRRLEVVPDTQDSDRGLEELADWLKRQVESTNRRRKDPGASADSRYLGGIEGAYEYVLKRIDLIRVSEPPNCQGPGAPSLDITAVEKAIWGAYLTEHGQVDDDPDHWPEWLIVAALAVTDLAASGSIDAEEGKPPTKTSEGRESIDWADVQVGDTLSLYTQVSGSEYEYLPVEVIVATEEEVAWRYSDGVERTMLRARLSGDRAGRIAKASPEQSHTEEGQ